MEVVADDIETLKQKRGDEEHHLPFGMEYNPELDDFPPHEPIMQPSEEEEDGEQEIKNRPYENSNEVFFTSLFFFESLRIQKQLFKLFQTYEKDSLQNKLAFTSDEDQ